jgi:2-polyprenyl-3-methyl-5-hydroxy-6-metoxy-1,4-benzoquinol methylase
VRERLQRKPFDYQLVRDSRSWFEHDTRLHVIAGMVGTCKGDSLIDPAAGDGALEELIEKVRPLERVTIGDISKPAIEAASTTYAGRGWTFRVGDILWCINESPAHDIVILSEVLEHLEDPDAVLRAARQTAKTLIASSPIMRTGQSDTNPEHLWMFDGPGYRRMIEDAGWKISHSAILRFPTMYDFQIWVATS